MTENEQFNIIEICNSPFTFDYSLRTIFCGKKQPFASYARLTVISNWVDLK
jgi:hypothetical protein